MSISSISPTANPDPAAGSSKRKTSLDQQDFFNLFITQLKNQNPLNPMDNYQMATQVAQFNSLDSLNRIQSSLELLGAYQSSMNSLQAAGLIGKRVETESQYLSLNGGKVSEGYYQLSKPGKVSIKIYGTQGQLVRTIEGGLKDGSKQKVVWDGKNQQGTLMPDGNYMFQVSAADEGGQSIPVYSSIVDTVTGVSFDQGVIYLDFGSKRIKMSDLLAIMN